MIILPISIWSQDTVIVEPYKMADSIIDVNKLLENEFGKNEFTKLKRMEEFGGFPGILELKNLLDKNIDSTKFRTFSACQCYMDFGRILITNAIGFTTGVGNEIEIFPEHEFFSTTLQYGTDGGKTHKFTKESDWVESIKLKFIETKLEISSDSKFENNGIIQGRLTAKTDKYFEYDYRGEKEIQTEMISIFRCRLQVDESALPTLEKIRKKQRNRNEKKN